MFLVDEGFAVFTGIREVSSREIEELVTHFVVICNYKDSIAVANSIPYIERYDTDVAFSLNFRKVTS